MSFLSTFLKKRKPLYPSFTSFNFSFNLTAIEEWSAKKSIISPAGRSKLGSYDDIRKVEISLLPTMPILYFHRDANRISPLFSGSIAFGEGDGYFVLYWRWENYSFSVVLDDGEQNTIIRIPDNEASYLISNGLISGSFFEESKVISLAENYKSDFCSNFTCSNLGGSTLTYSNELVEIHVSSCPSYSSGSISYDT
jgi:hypothetical protein